jgi:hypothetical protein
MDVAFWVDTHLTSAKFTENRETIHVDKYTYGVDPDSSLNTHVARYEYGKTPPITLGEIKNPANAYVHLKFRFRADSTAGYPNVFQTAPVNRGMRMEITGSTAGIIVPDLSVPGGLKGFTLTTALKTGHWYALEVEALNGVYVRVMLDGHLVADYASAGLSMETSQIQVGGGFDATRAFRGQIENIAITKGKFSTPIALGEIKNPDNAYVHLKLRFRADSTEGYPNVFQTAPVNRGMRMEISGSTAAIIVPDLAVPGGLRGLTLTTALKTGQWYTLEVEALNGAFVRILLDGKLVKDYYGAGLFMETSQLLVGGGFDASRAFRGQMDNISVMKGNLNLPHQGLRIVYVTLVAMIALFFFTLWKALGEYSAVQKVVGKLALLALPLVLILAYSEYRLSFLNTNYYTKRVALEQQIDKVEVLVVGSSNTVYGVAPEAFSHRGFNLSFPGNGMFFDARLVEKYSEKMPHLRMVVLTANYFTMGMDYSTFSQSWRQFFLRQNFNIPVKFTAGLSYDFGFWLNPRNFSRIALYGDQARGYVGANHFAPVDIITTPTGWFDSGDVSGDEHSKKLGIAGAEAHNVTTNVENYDRNLGYWKALIPLLQRKNIGVAIVLLPTDVSYHGHLDKAKVELMNRKLTEFTIRHHIRFVDYTDDARFSLHDYTPVYPDHMNARGAMKFSKILDEEVIKVQW